MVVYHSNSLEAHYCPITLRSLIKGGWPHLCLVVNTSLVDLKVALVHCSMDEVSDRTYQLSINVAFWHFKSIKNTNIICLTWQS